MLFLYYSLADALNKTVGEIMELPIAEVEGWVAYYKIKEERQER